MSDEMLHQWEELQTMVEMLNVDVTKNAAGNAAAGVRARKGLRELRAVTTTLIKTTLNVQKARSAKK